MRWKTRKRERKREGEEGRGTVVDSYVTTRRDPDCIFDAGLPLAAIKRLIRLRHCAGGDAKVMGTFPTRGGSEETWNAYLSRFAWSIKSGEQVSLIWIESTRRKIKRNWNFLQDCISFSALIKIWTTERKKGRFLFGNFVNKKMFGFYKLIMYIKG